MTESKIGQTETTTDIIDVWRVRALAATLGLGDVSDAPGAILPPAWHWAFFLPVLAHDDLGPDGHAARGEFLSPVDLPRRMWAGGRIEIAQPLSIGETATRKSTVMGITEKQGRSGRLVFVTMRHEITGNDGGSVTEDHDIVYRGPTDTKVSPPAAPTDGEWTEIFTPDPVMLFRYSALTFNGHRIHYDVDYCRKVEGYPGLVVHGPLTATLLLHLARQQCGGAAVTGFSFRGISPLFIPGNITLSGKRTETGASLWAANADGGLAVSAEVTFSE